MLKDWIKVFVVLVILIAKVFCNEMALKDSNCNVTYSTSDLIINYSNNESIHCINTIKASNDYRILITILKLNIPQQTNGHSNCKNYLSFSPVTPIESKVLKLCGQTESGNTSLAAQKQIISFNSSLTFQFHIEHDLSFNWFGFQLKIEFIRICRNVIINANNSQQNYCSEHNYSLIYSKESDVCFIEINKKIGETLELNVTKLITSEFLPTIGHFCKTQFIEILIDSTVYNICGNWSETDLSSMPTLRTQNSSIVVRIYASNNQHIITTDSADITTTLGFCITYQTFPEQLCQSSKGWFDLNDFCYKVYYEKKSWFEAQNVCRSVHLSGNLAAIWSTKIQKLFDNYLLNVQNIQNNQNKSTTTGSEYAFWIGGTDTKLENDYQWVDGHPFLYSNWFPGWPKPNGQDNYGVQPSDDGFSQQNCIEIRNKFYLANKGKGTTPSFYWNDMSCLNPNAFICQIPKTKAEKVSKSESLVNKTCDKEIILTSYYPWDVISTPNYPFSYPNHLNCTIRVSVLGNFSVELLFTDFLFEDGGESCSYDYIMIDDSRHGHKYCGDWTDKIKLLRSITGNITISVFSDSSHSHRGFRAELRLINNPSESGSALCENQRFRHFSGNCYLISSYPEVTWPTAHRICQDIQSELIDINSISDEKAFISLLLDNTHEARSDLSRPNRAFWLQSDNIEHFGVDLWLSDRFGPKANTELIKPDDNSRKSCVIAGIENMKKPKLKYNTIECNSNAGYICVKQAFDSKSAENTTLIDAFEGTLYSPNFPNSYFNRLFYTTTIVTNITNPVIIVWFESLDIEWQKQCLYDYLIIKDSQNEKRICGQMNDKKQLFNQTFISKSNSISITFHSDFSNRGNGFKLYWKAFAMNWCDLSQTSIGENNDSHLGLIESPGYPVWNLPNLNCSVIITSQSHKRVVLTIEDFDLDDFKEEFCKFDNYLVLDLGQSKSIQLCGSLNSRNILIGQQFISYGNSLKVHYITSSSLNSMQSKRGFRFSYSFIEKAAKISSIIELPANQMGKVVNLNYPHECPNDYQIFLKSQISHQIELRLPRLTYMKITDGSHCETINDRLVFNVIDPFGNISRTPPNPMVWSVCSESSEPFKTFSSLKSTETKAIKSKFHVLLIKAFNNQRNSFMFYYKTKKDQLFFNNTINLSQKLPVNTCEYKPCLNSGTCVRTGSNESYCECTQLWTGIFCHLTLCNTKPCGDHGICELNTDSSAGYVCHCDSGYIGPHCEHTYSPCTKSNPCGERGSCSLINGATQCKCHPWYEGIHCERFAFKIQYKPLSKKMLEEPFWLGLICVGTVLALLSIVYCIKKKFAERIEAFFAEEIEKSKSNYSIPRYSLTSNVGVSLNISPVNFSPLPRSRSTFMTRLRRHKMRRSSNVNHFSDSEAVNIDQFSDAESGGAYQPIPTFIRHASSARDSVFEGKDGRDEKSRILQSLVGSGNTPKNRRLSLDEFFQNNKRLKMQKIMQQTIDQSTSDLSLSDGESSFISSAKSPSSSPGRRSPVYLLRQFSAISEASQEEQCSRVVSRNNTLPGDSSSDSISQLNNSPIMKQESETEVLINGIYSIQRASRSQNNLLFDIDNPQPSTSGYIKQDKFISSTSSTSSGASTPNHFNPPSITVTDVAIERYDYDNEFEGPIHSSHRNRGSFSSAISELIVPVQSIRRLSEPLAKPNESGKRSPSPGSLSCGPLMVKKMIESTKGRKFSLEMVPKIQINVDKVSGDPNMTPNPCMKSMTCLAINASSDRTISESNLSTSGYSSFSSPGISRCNSSSPFPEEIGGVSAELTTIVIPDVPQMDFKHKYESKQSYGNFLSIPVFTFPTRDTSEKSKPLKPKTTTVCNPIVICPQIKISPAESDECLHSSGRIPIDEGIDIDLDFSREQKELINDNENYVSIELQSRPHSFLGLKHNSRENVRRKKKMITSPTHSLEEFKIETTRKSDTLKTPKIRRNPSWPAVMVSPNSSSSSEFEDNRSKCNKKTKKTYLTTKVKKLHKRRLKSRSKSQAESSLSVNSPMTDNCLSLSSRTGRKWFQSSSHSSSTESFLSTNDENTIISQNKYKKHNSSQSLFETNCDIFNTISDSTDSLGHNRQKQTIASISDTALDKQNVSNVNFNFNHLTASVSQSLDTRKRSKRKIQKQKAMQEDDQMSDQIIDGIIDGIIDK